MNFLMGIRRILISLAICISSIQHMFADQNDSIVTHIDSNCVFYAEEQMLETGLSALQLWDTTLLNIQLYDPVWDWDNYFACLGNTGKAVNPLVYKLSEHSGFDYGLHALDPYIYKRENVKYYLVYKPFTELFYLMGPAKEQLFRVIHSQNISKRWNVGINYRVINAPGNYLRQKSQHANFIAHNSFITKNMRYGFISHYTFNHLRNQENGGIANDTIFEENLEKRRDGIAVNLYSAENKWKESGIFLKQFFELSRRKSEDELNDSMPLKKSIRLGRISHSFHYHSERKAYYDQDPLSGYYLYVINDTTKTLDTLTVKILENSISWSNYSYPSDSVKKGIIFTLKLKQSYIEINENARKSYFLQYSPSTSLTLNIKKRLAVSVKGEIVTGEENEGDFLVSGQMKYSVFKGKNKVEICISAIEQLQEAAYFHKHYLGNHFSWENSFAKEKKRNISFGISYRKLLLGFDYFRLENLIYFDYFAYPRQYKESFSVFQYNLRKNFSIGNFHLDNGLIYQFISKRKFLRLPEFISRHSLYVKLPLFNNALEITTGFDIFYNSRYFADAYMPATGIYYVQPEKETGNYIYSDVFLSLKIKTARIFVKYQNLLGLFKEFNYVMVTHYPQQDPALKLGILWVFHN